MKRSVFHCFVNTRAVNDMDSIYRIRYVLPFTIEVKYGLYKLLFLALLCFILYYELSRKTRAQTFLGFLNADFNYKSF